MPIPQTAAFAPDASLGGSFGFASSRIALPGTLGGDSIVRVVNLGSCHIAVALGDVTVAVTQSTGLIILAGQTQYLVLGASTYIAGVSCGGPGNASTVNVSVGN